MLYRIEGTGRTVFGISLLVCPVSIFLLYVSTVPQHDFAQVVGCICAMDLPFESVLTEPGKVA
jgi:hypothetical protein